MKKVTWRGNESDWRNLGVARTWNAYWLLAHVSFLHYAKFIHFGALQSI